MEKESLNKDQLKQLLKEADLSVKEFCELTGIKEITARSWDSMPSSKGAKRKVPSWVESWLENYIQKKECCGQLEKVKQSLGTGSK